MSELRGLSRISNADAPVTPLYGAPIDQPSAWKVADFETLADYTIELTEAHLRDIEHAIRQIKTADLSLGIGTHLGRGLSQSVLGDRLGHVKDFSREDPLARAYRNKQELSPHTDSCDLVGLACLGDAKLGGVSRLTSAIHCP